MGILRAASGVADAAGAAAGAGTSGGPPAFAAGLWVASGAAASNPPVEARNSRRLVERDGIFPVIAVSPWPIPGRSGGCGTRQYTLIPVQGACASALALWCARGMGATSKRYGARRYVRRLRRTVIMPSRHRMQPNLIIAGGGLAGSEAAWQVAERGIPVTLYEMRPGRATPAHRTDRLAELVCSNSLKSNAPGSASWLLKEELRRGGSLLLRLADATAVPGGSALAVDRERFSAVVTAEIERHPRITIRREELSAIPGSESPSALVLIATGPLTSDALAQQLQRITGSENLAFYDSISPIVDAETVNLERVFRASRYGKGGEDYLNCPMDEGEYLAFCEAVLAAETVQTHDFEDLNYFEACLPIEELARR